MLVNRSRLEGKRTRKTLDLENRLSAWAKATKELRGMVDTEYVWVTGTKQTIPTGARRNLDVYLKVGSSTLYETGWESNLAKNYVVRGRVNPVKLNEQRLSRIELLNMKVMEAIGKYGRWPRD